MSTNPQIPATNSLYGTLTGTSFTKLRPKQGHFNTKNENTSSHNRISKMWQV